MLDLDFIRKEFASFLSTDPKGRWRMDAALAHIAQIAYEAGLKDGRVGEGINQPLKNAPRPDFQTQDDAWLNHT